MDPGDRRENTVLGNVSGAAVQAGSIHGDVHFHAVGTQPAVPRQLLPVPASFTDRERELARLDELLDNSQRQGPAVAVLAGSGGMGKTALASRWIVNQADRFPDGQLYANLGAFGGDGPTPPDEVLGGFLRALGVSPENVPSEISEQAAMYRSITAGKKIAVLADDADSAAQVRPLMPASPNSVVVVTSRWRLEALAFDGAQVLLVDPLDETAGLTLLKRTVGSHRVTVEPEPARELIELCGGMPIALCVAAARLSTRPRWPISHLVSVLADEKRRLSALTLANEAVVQASFDLSFGELTADTARVYRLLSLHPGRDFSTDLAAVALGQPVAEAYEALDSLVYASLLTDIEANRYQFHDLTRLHARQQAENDSETSRTAVLRRMVHWYLDNVVRADLAISPRRPRLGPHYEQVRDQPARFVNAPGALEWIEREIANVIAIVRAAFERRWWDEVWQLCEALWSFFLYRKHYPQWERSHRWGIDAAQHCGHRAAEARLQVQLGYAYLNTNRYDLARERFSASLEIGRVTNDIRVEATAWEHLGVVAQSTGDHRQAVEYFEQALGLEEELGQRRGVVLQLRRIGEATTALGEIDKALTYLNRSAEEAIAIGDTVLHARALTGLGRMHLQLDHLEEASGHLLRAVDLLEGSGADPYHAEVLEVLAEVAIRAGDNLRAHGHLEEALAIYNSSRDPKGRRVESRMASIAADTRKQAAEQQEQPPA